MKALGIVCEYNPLHNGHLYHLEESKRLINPEVTVAVMSGNFVQRGEPAFIDKYKRAKAAIDSGVDLIVELPTYYSLSSAEAFASGAVSTLAALKVESISFGSECAYLDNLSLIADALLDESEEYSKHLKMFLSEGLSFPAARQKALSISLCIDESLLNQANNILGIEYLKAIKKNAFPITPYTIMRLGSDYNDATIGDNLSSATAIRQNIINYGNIEPQVSSNIPDSMYSLMSTNLYESFPVVIDDFTHLFNYKMTSIISKSRFDKARIIEELCNFNDINADLAGRFYNAFDDRCTITEFIGKVKSKHFTYSRISRCVMNVILDMNNEIKQFYANTAVPYIRILGFNEAGKNYLNSIKKEISVPLITKTADYKNLLFKDIYCTNIYNNIIFNKYKTTLPDEFRAGVYVKS